MLRWFHALMPKEDRFFPMFAQHSRAVLAGAEALRAMLEGGDAIARNYQIVMDREHDADNVTREVLIAVRRTFITPFDRGNIRDLITVDGQFHRPDAEDRQVRQAVRRHGLHPAAEGNGGRHREVRATGAGRPAAAAIDQQRSHPHQRHHRSRFRRWRAAPTSCTIVGLHELYKANADRRTTALNFFVGNEVYDHLEKVVDRFDDVANVMHGIVIEHV